MEFSVPAWLGGLAGAIVAVVIYVPAIRIIERRWRGRMGPTTPEQRAAFEEKFSLARRAILGIDIAILATVGYWIGKVLGATGGSHPQL
jgi:hypothetical protein